MLKMVIVEDEPAILNGIKQMIASLNLSIEISGCCFNGKAALDLFEKIKPDIVLTDIKMPVMDGLELIKQTSIRWPDVEYIILSGYSDFEYARTAMKYGVTEYILKPSSEAEFKSVLERVCMNVEEQKNRYIKSNIEKSIFKHESYIDNKEICIEGYPNYYLALVCMGPFTGRFVDLIHPDKTIWNQENIEDYINEKIKDTGKCYVFDSVTANEKIFFLSAVNKSIIPIKRFINEIKLYLSDTGMPVTFVISGLFFDFNEINNELSKARIVLSNRIVIGKDKVIIVDNDEAEANYVAIDNQERQSIKHLIETENFNGIIKEFLFLSEGWKHNSIPQAICEFSVKYVISEIYNHFHYIQKENPLEFYLNKVECTVCSSKSFEEFNEGIISIIKGIQEDLRNLKVDLDINEVVEQVHDYICEHYTESISYEQMSKKFGYHATYISNTFREIKGISPNKLITNLRIEKAKKLLVNFDYPLKDIASMVGYNDVFYFSRTFKGVVGKSPKQYRDSN